MGTAGKILWRVAAAVAVGALIREGWKRWSKNRDLRINQPRQIPDRRSILDENYVSLQKRCRRLEQEVMDLKGISSKAEMRAEKLERMLQNLERRGPNPITSLLRELSST